MAFQPGYALITLMTHVDESTCCLQTQDVMCTKTCSSDFLHEQSTTALATTTTISENHHSKPNQTLRRNARNGNDDAEHIHHIRGRLRSDPRGHHEASKTLQTPPRTPPEPSFPHLQLHSNTVQSLLPHRRHRRVNRPPPRHARLVHESPMRTFPPQHRHRLRSQAVGKAIPHPARRIHKRAYGERFVLVVQV